MNKVAAQVPVGSEGLSVLPYGNGAERTLENRNLGASVHGWNSTSTGPISCAPRRRASSSP